MPSVNAPGLPSHINNNFIEGQDIDLDQLCSDRLLTLIGNMRRTRSFGGRLRSRKPPAAFATRSRRYRDKQSLCLLRWRAVLSRSRNLDWPTQEMALHPSGSNRATGWRTPPHEDGLKRRNACGSCSLSTKIRTVSLPKLRGSWERGMAAVYGLSCTATGAMPPREAAVGQPRERDRVLERLRSLGFVGEKRETRASSGTAVPGCYLCRRSRRGYRHRPHGM